MTNRIIRAFMRHWLDIILVPLLLFVLLPFAAPVAMHWGWTEVGKAIYLFYSPFCHQLPERSWFFFGDKLTYTVDEIFAVYPYTDGWRLRWFIGTEAMGWKVAWSDRMISFYTMTPLLMWVYRVLVRYCEPISGRLFVLTLLPMAMDGGTHLINDVLTTVGGWGFRDQNAWLAWLTGNAFPDFYAGHHFGTFNWWMRLLTGLLAAWGLTFWATPWADHWVKAEEKRLSELIEQTTQ